jgi:uncharacterized membrane protein
MPNGKAELDTTQLLNESKSTRRTLDELAIYTEYFFKFVKVAGIVVFALWIAYSAKQVESSTYSTSAADQVSNYFMLGVSVVCFLLYVLFVLLGYNCYA